MTSHLFVKYLFLCANFKHQWFNKKKKKNQNNKKSFLIKTAFKKNEKEDVKTGETNWNEQNL